MGIIDESYNLKSPLNIKIEWCRKTETPPITLSISALLLNKETNLVDKIEDFVFYGTPPSVDSKRISTENGGVKCDTLDFKKGFGTGAKYEMNIDLDKINKDISKVRIIACIIPKNEYSDSVPGFDNLAKARFTLKDGAGNVYWCDLEKNVDSLSRSVDVAIVQRWDKNWRLIEELIFHHGGLQLIYNDDSYVSDLVSREQSFEEIADLVKIEEVWKRTRTTTRMNKAGKKIVTTVTNVLQTCTETLGITEEKEIKRGRIVKRKVRSVKPNIQNSKNIEPKTEEQRSKRPIVSRKSKVVDRVEEVKASKHPINDGRKTKGKIIKRQQKDDVDLAKLISVDQSGIPIPESNKGNSNNSKRKHPVIRRK